MFTFTSKYSLCSLIFKRLIIYLSIYLFIYLYKSVQQIGFRYCLQCNIHRLREHRTHQQIQKKQ